jgi:hypothetical protein
MRIILPLSSADLLRNQLGAVLQIATDVTHLMIPHLSTHALKRPKGEAVPANLFRAGKYEST